MRKIVITGSNGIIGNVLMDGLSGEFEITPINKPNIDVRKYDQLIKAIPLHEAIIHLAWNTKVDNMRSEKISPDNTQMFYNVYQAAREVKVKRVIMASSVHADAFYDFRGPGLLSPEKTPIPDSPYGAHKVGMEALGRYYASKGLEVVCVRFGGVNQQNKPASDPPNERAVFFSHRDCVSLLKSIIKAPKIPNNFCIVYGISDNKNRSHDIVNPFGWIPKDAADDF